MCSHRASRAFSTFSWILEINDQKKEAPLSRGFFGCIKNQKV